MASILKFIGTPYFNGQSIIYNAVNEYHYEDGDAIKVETCSLDFFGDGFIFANEFLAIMNKTLGTNYAFSESYKDEIGKKHGNINMHKSFELSNGWGGDSYSLYHHYDYDSVKNCTSNFGTYTKEELIIFADAVDAYNKGEDRRTSEFNPEYKVADEIKAEVAKEYADVVSATDKTIDEGIKALQKSMEGLALESAITALREGYRWTYTRARDIKSDKERNIELDEKENIIREVYKRGIKRYKDYFTDEIFNTKREKYYSWDDRFRSNAGVRYDEKNGESFFTIMPQVRNDKIRFSFGGEILIKKWREEPIRRYFSLDNLTYEELLMVVDTYNELYHDAKWGK